MYWSSYSQHAEWIEARAHLGKMSTPFMLMLTAVLGEGNNIIAVDDVVHKDCALPPSQEICENQISCDNKACYDSIQHCDLTDDCGDSSDEKEYDDFIICQFEDSLCNWENLDDDSGMLFKAYISIFNYYPIFQLESDQWCRQLSCPQGQ
jgi:hypothetical protein